MSIIYFDMRQPAAASSDVHNKFLKLLRFSERDRAHYASRQAEVKRKSSLARSDGV